MSRLNKLREQTQEQSGWQTQVESATYVHLTDIRTDLNLQHRESIDENVVNDYIEILKNGGELAPVKLVRDGEGNLWLWDGHQTLKAAKEAGVPQLKAEIEKGTKREAWFNSLGANATHGARRKPADVSKAIRDAITDRDIRYSLLAEDGQYNFSNLSQIIKASRTAIRNHWTKYRSEINQEIDEALDQYADIFAPMTELTLLVAKELHIPSWIIEQRQIEVAFNLTPDDTEPSPARQATTPTTPPATPPDEKEPSPARQSTAPTTPPATPPDDNNDSAYEPAPAPVSRAPLDENSQLAAPVAPPVAPPVALKAPPVAPPVAPKAPPAAHEREAEPASGAPTAKAPTAKAPPAAHEPPETEEKTTWTVEELYNHDFSDDDDDDDLGLPREHYKHPDLPIYQWDPLRRAKASPDEIEELITMIRMAGGSIMEVNDADHLHIDAKFGKKREELPSLPDVWGGNTYYVIKLKVEE